MENLKLPETPKMSNDSIDNISIDGVKNNFSFLNDNTSQVFEKAMGKNYQNVLNDNIYLGLLLLLVISSVVAYALYYFISKTFSTNRELH